GQRASDRSGETNHQTPGLEMQIHRSRRSSRIRKERINRKAVRILPGGGLPTRERWVIDGIVKSYEAGRSRSIKIVKVSSKSGRIWCGASYRDRIVLTAAGSSAPRVVEDVVFDYARTGRARDLIAEECLRVRCRRDVGAADIDTVVVKAI